MGMVYHLIFLFQSCRLLNTILSFHNNREFHSSILGVIFWCHPLLLGCHFLSVEYHSLSLGCHFGCHSGFSVHFFCFCLLFCLLYWASVHLFCLHFRYNVHHLNYLAHRFHCFGVHSKFWGSYYRTAILFDEKMGNVK